MSAHATTSCSNRSRVWGAVAQRRAGPHTAVRLPMFSFTGECKIIRWIGTSITVDWVVPSVRHIVIRLLQARGATSPGMSGSNALAVRPVRWGVWGSKEVYLTTVPASRTTRCSRKLNMSAESCQDFFTQNTDISGIGVRVAFYLQLTFTRECCHVPHSCFY